MRGQLWRSLSVLFLLTALTPKSASALHENCIENGGWEICTPVAVTSWCYGSTHLGTTAPSVSIRDGVYDSCYLSEQAMLEAFAARWPGSHIESVVREWTSEHTVNGLSSQEVKFFSVACTGPGECWPYPPFGNLIVYRLRYFPCALREATLKSGIVGGLGFSQCLLEQVPESESSCRIGNPISIGSMRKTQTEIDYVSPSPGSLLTFSRLYDSTGTHSDATHFIGAKWSSNLSARFFEPNVASPGASPTVRYHTNAVEGFQKSGTNFIPWGDARGHLRKEVNGQGVTTAWLHTGKDNHIRRFLPSGLLEKEIASNGRSIHLTYSGVSQVGAPACRLAAAPVGALWCITDEMGRQLDFEYDALRRLARVVNPANESVRFAYDEPAFITASGPNPVNALTTVTYPDGTKRHHYYNEAANMSGASSSWALTGVAVQVSPGVIRRVGTYQYDSSGRAKATTRAGGIDSYVVSPSGTTRTVTDPLGTVRTHQFSFVAGAWRQTSTTQPEGSGSTACSDTVTYDARGNVSSRIDYRGVNTCYAYDSTRNLETKRVEGIVNGATCDAALASTPPNARVVTTEWHPEWRVAKRIAEPKRITTITYNGSGTTCAPVANPITPVVCSRREQATTDETGTLGFAATTTGTARTWSYTYATFGRVLTATDPNNRTTTYTYHPTNDVNIGKRGNIATIVNAANHLTQITDYNAHGQPTRTVDPNGLVTVLTYDALTRLKTSTSGTEQTSYLYNHPTGQLTEATLPDGSRLTYSYDDADRLTRITDQKGNRIEYTLDLMGNRTGEQVKDAAGQLKTNIVRLIDAVNRVRQLTGSTQ